MALLPNPLEPVGPSTSRHLLLHGSRLSNRLIVFQLDRECEEKLRAYADIRLYPNTATVLFDGSLADCEAQPCTGILRAVQPLENTEYGTEVLRRDSHAVVFHREHPLLKPAHR